MPIIDRAERALARHRACRKEMEAQEDFDDGDLLPDRPSSRHGGGGPGTTERDRTGNSCTPDHDGT